MHLLSSLLSSDSFSPFLPLRFFLFLRLASSPSRSFFIVRAESRVPGDRRNGNLSNLAIDSSKLLHYNRTCILRNYSFFRKLHARYVYCFLLVATEKERLLRYITSCASVIFHIRNRKIFLIKTRVYLSPRLLLFLYTYTRKLENPIIQRGEKLFARLIGLWFKV